MFGWVRRLIEHLSKPCEGRGPDIPCLYCDCERVREYYTEKTQAALAARQLPTTNGRACGCTGRCEC